MYLFYIVYNTTQNYVFGLLDKKVGSRLYNIVINIFLYDKNVSIMVYDEFLPL
jgi:hypothetical protein